MKDNVAFTSFIVAMSPAIKHSVQRVLRRLGYEIVRAGSTREMGQRAQEAELQLAATQKELGAARTALSQLIAQQEVAEEKLTQLTDRVAQLQTGLTIHPMPELEAEFAQLGFASAALQKLVRDYAFHSVLDIGAGSLAHSKILAAHGKAVTAVDFGTSVYHQQRTAADAGQIVEVIGDFNQLTFDAQFDCVWASHVLEHQPNVDTFLRKLVSLVKEEGVIAITVPPLKHEIVGGHVSLWNAGLLIYRMVLAGLDCAEASVRSYGYNISVIVRKKSIGDLRALDLHFDAGDIRKLIRFLPPGLSFSSNLIDDPFDGNIWSIGWS